MALAAILEVVCEEDIAVLEVTLLWEQCTIVGLLHRAPQVLPAAQVRRGDREEVAAGLLVGVVLGLCEERAIRGTRGFGHRGMSSQQEGQEYQASLSYIVSLRPT